MRYWYNTVFYLAFPLVLLRLLWRSVRLPDYRKRILERLGFFASPGFEKSIWIHAVSVGEFLAALPFIQELKVRHPQYPIVITTTTPTGSKQVQQKLGQDVFHVYAPYDLPGSVKRFLRRVKPVMLIIMETEIWPNYLYYCHQQNIQSVLINGRLSAKSAKGYCYFKSFVHKTLSYFTHIVAQFSADAARYKALGAKDSHVSVAGNSKFDMTLAQDIIEKGQLLRKQLGTQRPVWIAASTHEGEETHLLQVHAELLKSFPDCLLILVPRHPDRFEQVATVCEKSGLTMTRRTRQQSPADVNIYLGDTMGEMMVLYGACDVAFVGGSFIPVGGHNVLEPAQLEKPVLSGPHVFNFLAISELMQETGALKIVHTDQELLSALTELFQREDLRKKMGEGARVVIANNRGALKKQLDVVSNLLVQGSR